MWRLRICLVLLLMVPAFVLLVSGCASGSTSSSLPGVAPAAIPPLPAAARVSQVPTPLICSPNCTAGQTARRQSSLNTPTDSALPASSAKPLTTP
jgi:hypothetical protein